MCTLHTMILQRRVVSEASARHARHGGRALQEPYALLRVRQLLLDTDSSAGLWRAAVQSWSSAVTEFSSTTVGTTVGTTVDISSERPYSTALGMLRTERLHSGTVSNSISRSSSIAGGLSQQRAPRHDRLLLDRPEDMIKDTFLQGAFQQHVEKSLCFEHYKFLAEAMAYSNTTYRNPKQQFKAYLEVIARSVVPRAVYQVHLSNDTRNKLLHYKSAKEFQQINPESRRLVFKKACAEVSEMQLTVYAHHTLSRAHLVHVYCSTLAFTADIPIILSHRLQLLQHTRTASDETTHPTCCAQQLDDTLMSSFRHTQQYRTACLMQQREDGLEEYARLEQLELTPVAPSFDFMSI
eukprot:8075-Heterococcus_DN1.PRE.3